MITDWVLAHLTPPRQPPQPEQQHQGEQQAAEREHQQDEATQR